MVFVCGVCVVCGGVCCMCGKEEYEGMWGVHVCREGLWCICLCMVWGCMCVCGVYVSTYIYMFHVI